MKITPVILSGGSGTRLWPLSRSLNPKQFLNFLGENSLFQETALRTKNKVIFHNPVIVCNNEHRFIAAEELKKINITPKSIILEPTARNTAPAIGIAVLDIMKNNQKQDDLILIMPSDHVIKNEKKFIAQIEAAKEAAAKGYLVTFGILPTSAETGYGYIKHGKSTRDCNEVFLVDEFIEKPKKELAEKLVKNKNYLWNSGVLLFKASTYLEALQKFQSDTFVACCASYSKAEKDLDFIRLNAQEFEKCQNISVDYAILEKSEKVAVLPVSDIEWSDVGNWGAISEISNKDSCGNSFSGDIIALKTENCYINSKSGIIATIGVKNLIIVALKDAILVADKNNSQEVKDLFEILKSQKREECNSHTRVLRPWGSFETIDFSERFKVKRITVNPEASLSLQMHNHRSEHWVVVKGTARVTCDGKEIILTEDQSTYIPVGKKHRLENRGKIPLEIIEVQTGNYLEEDDIIRFDDIYGR